MGVTIVAEDIQARIITILDSFKPLIEQHGGSIVLDIYENNIVYVLLEGACATCLLSVYTLKLGIEEALKKAIPEITEVVAREN